MYLYVCMHAGVFVSSWNNEISSSCSLGDCHVFERGRRERFCIHLSKFVNQEEQYLMNSVNFRMNYSRNCCDIPMMCPSASDGEI